MSSRLVQGIAAGLGAAALVTAVFTQGVTTVQSSTVQSGTHTQYSSKPITFDLIPAAKKSQPKRTVQNDATKLYDYINPCSLIPLDAIHKITGDYALKFNSKRAGLTTDPADAAVNTSIVPQLCMIAESLGNVKPSMLIGVMTQQSTAFYKQFRDSWNNGSLHVQDVDAGGLPSAREASVIYITRDDQRVYSMLLVHTKYGQTLAIKWTGKNTVPVLRQLAYEALRTLNGSRYPGK